MAGTPRHVEESDSSKSQLLGFLHLPPAGAFAQFLLGFDRRGGDGGSVVMVILWSGEGGAKKHVADPGFNEGEWRAVGVSGCHHNLRGGGGWRDEVQEDKSSCCFTRRVSLAEENLKCC